MVTGCAVSENKKSSMCHLEKISHPTLDILVFYSSLNFHPPRRCARRARHFSQHSTSTQMLLAHKPHPLPIMSPNITHRRHPSAPPAVVVQATKTPGLLFVSKQPSRASTPRNPPQQPQSHPHKQFRSPKPKGRTSQPQILEAHLSDDSAKPAVQKVSSDVPAAVEKKLVHPATPTPDKSSRGRQSKTPKDKATTR